MKKRLAGAPTDRERLIMQPLALGQIGRCAWELGLLLQPEVNFLGMKAC